MEKNFLEKIKKFLPDIPFQSWSGIPALVIFNFLFIVPVIIAIWLSLVNWQVTFGMDWWSAPFYGVRNFVDILSDSEFIASILRTFFIVGVVVPIEFLIGLSLALLLQGDMPGKNVFILIFILPLLVLPLVLANNFYIIFQARGVLNFFINTLTGSTSFIPWLGEENLAYIPIMTAEIWHWYPFMFLICLSGLASVPETQINAARTLGASRWQIFRKITLPNMKNIIIIAFVIKTMLTFKIFTIVQGLTSGGPGNATETIGWYLYEKGILQFKTSFAAAGSWVILIILVIFFSYILSKFLLTGER